MSKVLLRGNYAELSLRGTQGRGCSFVCLILVCGVVYMSSRILESRCLEKFPVTGVTKGSEGVDCSFVLRGPVPSGVLLTV